MEESTMESIKRYSAFYTDIEQTELIIDERINGEYIKFEDIRPVIESIVKFQYYDNQYLEALKILEELIK
jgi:hypothetical protein